MWWKVEKLAARIAEMKGVRYRDSIPIDEMMTEDDEEGLCGAAPPASFHGRTMRRGDVWSGRDRYVWLAADVEVPEAWRGRKTLGRFDFGVTGGGNNSGFEALLFLNGVPYQGIDTNHQEVLFPEAAGTTLQLRVRLWSGLNGYQRQAELEHRIKMAEICWLDDAADDLYFTGEAVLATIRLMEEHRPEREQLTEALDNAMRLVDWSIPGSEEWDASLAAARRQLQDRLRGLPKHHAVTVRCIGHTHIDIAWLWRLKHTREKAARSFSTVLRLMERYPEYVFLQSQPQLYEYMKTDYPQIYEQMKRRVEEGRWEAGGAMWLEADCNLPSGESLVRQLLHGIRFFQQEFGADCKYLWLPDVFGYCWALPQILRKSGIEAFMTTKISWNQYNRMPHDTFVWRGMDGTEIVAHFITTPSDGRGEDELCQFTYNGDITPESVHGIWNAYRDKALNRDLLMAYGYGDGGGGATRDMLEMRRRLERLPGLPHVETGRADEYFQQLKETISRTDQYVHVWDGEMYLELHRGTYTSQAWIKRMNRKLELLYREAEWLGALRCSLAGDWSAYNSADLLRGWKIILRNQFHDIIPGSSIREVYEDARLEYEEAWEIGNRLVGEAAAAIVAPSEESREAGIRYYTVFNGSPWRTTELAAIDAAPGMERGIWRDADGSRLDAQFGGGGWLVAVPGIPAMGMAGIAFEASELELQPAAESPFLYSDRSLDTPFYSLRWDAHGRIIELYDKRAGRQVLAPGGVGNELQVFEDKPKSRHEAWDIDIFYQEKMERVEELVSVMPVMEGPLAFAVRFEWRYRRSTIAQDLILYRDNPCIEFRTRVDWSENRKLLKTAFTVDIRATEATYDVQFGNVKRPTHWNTSWDYARFESVGHQWSDLSESDYGVSLLNDCKYGYDIKDNAMRLSLIKSAMVPDEQADQGEHRFTYALLPHQGDWRAGGTAIRAWALNSPLRAMTGRMDEAFSMLAVDREHVMIDAVKKAEDRDTIVVRLHEFAGARGNCTLNGGWSGAAWRELDLREQPTGEWTIGVGVPLYFKPYEIKTIELIPHHNEDGGDGDARSTYG